MTNPPPPGNWGPPQPPYGQGQPPYGPGQWPPQQAWGAPPQPPTNNHLKWLLIGVAVLLVIAISVGATLLFTRDGGGGSTQTATGSPSVSDFASAGDTRPVSVITDEPTCGAVQPVLDALGEQQRQGWTDRDYSLPASSWTPEIRATYRASIDAMLRASEQLLQLTKKTPNRVVRELYTTAIVYWHAYADAIDTYEADDNHLVLVANNAVNAVLSICTTIDYKVASKRSALLPVGPEPPSTAPPVDPASAERFITQENGSACDHWTSASKKFDLDTEPWRNSDVNLPASQWPAEQRSMMDRQALIMSAYADDIEELGKNSENAVFGDFAQLSAQYWRAFVEAIPTYDTADSYFSSTASHADSVILNACAAIRR